MLINSDYDKILKFVYAVNQYLDNLNEQFSLDAIDEKKNFRTYVLNLLSEIFDFQDLAFHLADEKQFYRDPVSVMKSDFHFIILNSYNQLHYKTDIFHITNISNHLLSNKVLKISDLKPYCNEDMYLKNIELLSAYGYQDMRGLPLMKNNKLIGGIAVYRSKQGGNFSNKDIEILHRVNEHITQGLNTYQKISQAMHEKYIFKNCSDNLSTGVIILNSSFRVTFSNCIATENCEDLFSQYQLGNEIRHTLAGSTQFIMSLLISRMLSENLFEEVNQNSHAQINLNNYSFNVSSFIAPKEKLGLEVFYLVNIVKNDLNKEFSFDKAASYYKLTKKEVEIVNLLTKGYSNKEISHKLSISIHTVRTHVFNIFKKTGVSNRSSIMHKMAGFI